MSAQLAGRRKRRSTSRRKSPRRSRRSSPRRSRRSSPRRSRRSSPRRSRRSSPRRSRRKSTRRSKCNRKSKKSSCKRSRKCSWVGRKSSGKGKHKEYCKKGGGFLANLFGSKVTKTVKKQSGGEDPVALITALKELAENDEIKGGIYMYKFQVPIKVNQMVVKNTDKDINNFQEVKDVNEEKTQIKVGNSDIWVKMSDYTPYIDSPRFASQAFYNDDEKLNLIEKITDKTGPRVKGPPQSASQMFASNIKNTDYVIFKGNDGEERGSIVSSLITDLNLSRRATLIGDELEVTPDQNQKIYFKEYTPSPHIYTQFVIFVKDGGSESNPSQTVTTSSPLAISPLKRKPSTVLKTLEKANELGLRTLEPAHHDKNVLDSTRSQSSESTDSIISDDNTMGVISDIPTNPEQLTKNAFGPLLKEFGISSELIVNTSEKENNRWMYDPGQGEGEFIRYIKLDEESSLCAFSDEPIWAGSDNSFIIKLSVVNPNADIIQYKSLNGKIVIPENPTSSGNQSQENIRGAALRAKGAAPGDAPTNLWMRVKKDNGKYTGLSVYSNSHSPKSQQDDDFNFNKLTNESKFIDINSYNDLTNYPSIFAVDSVPKHITPPDWKEFYVGNKEDLIKELGIADPFLNLSEKLHVVSVPEIPLCEPVGGEDKKIKDKINLINTQIAQINAEKQTLLEAAENNNINIQKLENDINVLNENTMAAKNETSRAKTPRMSSDNDEIAGKLSNALKTNQQPWLDKLTILRNLLNNVFLIWEQAKQTEEYTDENNSIILECLNEIKTALDNGIGGNIKTGQQYGGTNPFGELELNFEWNNPVSELERKQKMLEQQLQEEQELLRAVKVKKTESLSKLNEKHQDKLFAENNFKEAEQEITRITGEKLTKARGRLESSQQQLINITIQSINKNNKSNREKVKEIVTLIIGQLETIRDLFTNNNHLGPDFNTKLRNISGNLTALTRQIAQWYGALEKITK